MEASFKQSYSDKTSKEDKYKIFLEQFAPLIEDEKDIISVLANTAAALKEAFDFFWVGFYLVDTKGSELQNGEILKLGPFQGSVACYRIKKGRGVCGTAWSEAQTQVVPDVDKFPGHIACSSLSRSEIVVPIIVPEDSSVSHPSKDPSSQVVGVLDIDSDQLNTFDETDKVYLEKVVGHLVQNLFIKK